MTTYKLLKKLLHHKYSITNTLHLVKIFIKQKEIYVIINNQVMHYVKQ